MNISEKVAYIKGLMEGLDMDFDSKEGKLFSAIVDALEEIALSMEEVEDEVDALDSVVAEIDEDLGEVEEELYGADECDCCDCDEFEVECPSCGEVLTLEDEDLENGAVKCPNCGEEFELEFDDDDECDCCDCGCEDEKE